MLLRKIEEEDADVRGEGLAGTAKDAVILLPRLRRLFAGFIVVLVLVCIVWALVRGAGWVRG